MKIISVLITTFLLGCGSPSAPQPESNTNQDRINELEKEYEKLLNAQILLNDLITSDFATCPEAGDTADPLINKMCKVANASTVEARTELKGQLSALDRAMNEQLVAINNNIVELQTQIDAGFVDIDAQILAIEDSITSLSNSLNDLITRVDDLETAVTELQNIIGDLSGDLDGAMTSVEVGTENLFAGPYYESLIRSVDKTTINGYVEENALSITIANNGITATNGSGVITVTTSSAHGLAVDNIVHLTGLGSGRGLTIGDLTGDFIVTSIVSTTKFTVQLTRLATSNGTLGGANGYMYQVLARGIVNIWSIEDGADAAVRIAMNGSKRYNYIITATGDVCYDKTNTAALFATIDALGTNISCK